MPKKQKEKDGKLGLVVGTTPDRFELGDTRLMKPVCHQKYENGSLQGSMLIQDIDKVSLSKKSSITYFVPNNVALLLSGREPGSHLKGENRGHISNTKYSAFRPKKSLDRIFDI
ncbi:MAG: hypothetical protein JRC90_10590 [Deltaproteobacteria bacterium]|nr:hypothetical protein [Deltaproteobacteria bacterium]